MDVKINTTVVVSNCVVPHTILISLILLYVQYSSTAAFDAD